MPRFAPQRSEDMQRAIHALRTGQTRGQKEQAMLDKGIFAVGQTGLMLGGAALQANESDKLQEEQKNRSDQTRNRDNQIAMRDNDLRHSKEASVYDDASQVHETGVGGRPPDWLAQSQGDNRDSPPGPDPFVQDAAKKAREQQGSNAEAAGASIGGYRTVQGLDDADQQSDVLAADMSTGKNLMKAGGMMTGGGEMGGMMSSLPRRGY